MDWAERLVGATRERQTKSLKARERVPVAVSALGFGAAAAGLAMLFPVERDVDPVLLAALVIGYALLSRIEFEIGAGSAVPEALLFVPILFIVPLALVPPLVACAFVLAWAPAFLRGETHVERALYGVSDAWFTIGPVLVIGLLAPGAPELTHLDIYALAFAASVVSGAAPVLFHERVGKGIRPSETLRALAWSYRTDAALWPVGLMAAVAATHMPAILLGIAPLVWLLSVFSRERRERYAAALELSRAYRGTVMLLSDVVEAEDDYTADHCRSVVELVNAVADEMKVAPDARQELEFAALLHDVGKIAIPNEILNKPGSLTEAEFELMKTHTIEGQLLLDRVGGLLGRVGRIVRSCHERWDGSGYPDGLRGKQIPPAARIVFACDAYNAMTTDRPYRSALPDRFALAELHANAGTQFDPEVVAALTRVVERGDAESRPSPAEAVRALFAQRELAEPARVA